MCHGRNFRCGERLSLGNVAYGGDLAAGPLSDAILVSTACPIVGAAAIDSSRPTRRQV